MTQDTDTGERTEPTRQLVYYRAHKDDPAYKAYRREYMRKYYHKHFASLRLEQDKKAA